MRLIILTAVLCSFSITELNAQYVVYKDTLGVEFATKWGREIWYKKKSDKVLLVRVINKNEEAVKFSLGVEFSDGIQLIEESKEQEYCLGAKRKLLPRANGIMYKQSGGKDTQSAQTNFELTGFEIEKVPVCE